MLRNFLRTFVLGKVVSLLLIGTAWAIPVNPNVSTFAHAIAKAEGYGIAGTIPTRCHNPGDLKGTKFDGQVGVCKGGHARFKNDSYGWTALYNQIDKMISGNSRVYHVSMTFAQVSMIYAGNSKVWLRNVCHEMAIDPNTTFMAYFDLNRQSYTTELETESYPFVEEQ
jgi:hypothetical protein